ncbi:uncharacterized protein BO80DRAFT_428579 [Aspergillus ibericus CBS 121593]|uniref:Nucleoside phosphorylase domain-containing protein n=1 Tax=Aspergillus ibericus CBS 121593 TaxID=1448316 RepID=A0A395GNI5_9EURO|nr:hypothetical protein BO80DRAFT_428579 [Aspergillus ibericus CBS 121593]RAK97065.1 hypothetical protein BO80DRAFT_428579 [Aspergillus ibericus CBS 121593]
MAPAPGSAQQTSLQPGIWLLDDIRMLYSVFLLTRGFPGYILLLSHWGPARRFCTAPDMNNLCHHTTLSICTHRMRESLRPYVFDKIHPLVSSRIWSRIIVRGHYARQGKDVHISSTEKKDKRFNWQRPTATILDDETLEICCFPGEDYVRHYSLLMAYHLALNDIRQSSAIECFPPSSGDTMGIFERSNLRLMGKVDTVVLGCVEYLVPGEEQVPWETGTSATDQVFAWKVFRRDDEHVVSFLACLVSLWGDTLGTVVRALRQLNDVSCVLYMGKAGSLRPEDTPNNVLVSGEASYVAGKQITWDNVLKPAISAATTARVCHGINVTVPTPLVETDAWFEQWKRKADWVDCEIGHAAEACQANEIKFGYLHLISDNVARYYPQNLATERQPTERLARRRMFQQMQDILSLHLQLGDTAPGPE